MKTKILFCLLVTLSVFSAIGQSGADWNAYKRANGIDAHWTYNAWVAAGMPRGGGGNNAGGNSGSSAADIAAQQAAAEAAAARNAAALAQQKLADDAFNRDDFTTAEAEYKKCLDYWPNNPHIIGNIAAAQNQEGLAPYKKGDYTTALKYFQQALATLPEPDERRGPITDNIAAAKEKIAEAEQAQKSKIAVNNIIQNLAQTVNAAPATGGLDFDGDKVDSSPKGDKGLSLTPTTSVSDPMVVDARNVPTGLPKSVADAIPQTPAGDRVRKGFEAIQTHDWKVALAWFQDALNHEPGDPGLQRLVDLAQFTMQRESQPATIVGPDEDLKDGLNDFDKNYVPIHPDSPFPKVTITTPAETEQEQLKESELKSQTTAVAPTGSDAADGKRKAGDDFSNLKRNTPIKDSPYETTMSDEEWFKQGNDSAFKRWMDARDNVKRENETPEGLFNERENSSWRNFFRLLTHKTEDEPIRIDANGIRD